MSQRIEEVGHFRFPLVPCEFTVEHPDIRSLAEHPNLVCKLVSGFDCFFAPIEKNWPKIQQTTKLWHEFGSYRGINLPRYQPVVGKFNEDSRSFYLFVIMEKVSGDNLEYRSFSESEKNLLYPQFETLFDSVVKYSCDKSTKGGYYFYDQKLEQYVLGTTANDPEKKIYFVDLDNTNFYFDAKDKGAENNKLFWDEYLGWVYEIMHDIELKLGNKPMVQARRRLYNLVSKIDIYHPYYQYAARLRNRLYLPPPLPNIKQVLSPSSAL